MIRPRRNRQAVRLTEDGTFAAESLSCSGAWHKLSYEQVERLNLVWDGWGRCFKCGYPSRQLTKVNDYVRCRLCKFLKRKSLRRYRLKYAETCYGELQKLGLIALMGRRCR